MKLYVKIIGTNILIVLTINMAYCLIANLSLGLAMLYAFLSLAICGGTCGIISILSHLLPKVFFSQKNPCFHVFGFERNLYEKIMIKKWKDKIPELGKLCGFKKDKLYNPNDPIYMKTAIQQNCIAESLHSLSALIGIAIFFVLPSSFVLSVGIPVFVLNSVLHGLPVLIQRYHRPKFVRIYEYTLKRNSIDLNMKIPSAN